MNKERYLGIMLPALLLVLITLLAPPFSLKLPMCMLLVSGAMLISNLPQPGRVKVKSRSERHY